MGCEPPHIRRCAITLTLHLMSRLNQHCHCLVSAGIRAVNAMEVSAILRTACLLMHFRQLTAEGGSSVLVAHPHLYICMPMLVIIGLSGTLSC